MKNLDDMYVAICKAILTGDRVSPRGLTTRELLCTQMQIPHSAREPNTLPSIHNKARGLNYAFHVVETLQYILHENDPKTLAFYNPNVAEFANEQTGKFDGAYGPRLKLGHVIEHLAHNPESRQAVQPIFCPRDQLELVGKSKDVPCTLSLHFLVRDEVLHMIVTMRSNDVLWGWPYDVMAFNVIQNLVANRLELSLGSYFHNVASLHMYEDRFDEVKKVIKCRDSNSVPKPPRLGEGEDLEEFSALYDHAKARARGEESEQDWNASVHPWCTWAYDRIEGSKHVR